MLTLLTRKLCPILTLAIATVGCGKKIGESDSSPASTIQNQELPSAFILQLDSTLSRSKSYLMPRNGRFKVPPRLKVQQGSGLNKSVDVRYQANPYNDEDFQFKCTYVGSSATEMRLSKCVDYDEGNLGDISDELFALYKGDSIEMRFSGPTALDGLVVDSIHSVEWK